MQLASGNMYDEHLEKFTISEKVSTLANAGRFLYLFVFCHTIDFASWKSSRWSSSIYGDKVLFSRRRRSTNWRLSFCSSIMPYSLFVSKSPDYLSSFATQQYHGKKRKKLHLKTLRSTKRYVNQCSASCRLLFVLNNWVNRIVWA